MNGIKEIDPKNYYIKIFVNKKQYYNFFFPFNINEKNLPIFSLLINVNLSMNFIRNQSNFSFGVNVTADFFESTQYHSN